VLTEFFIEEFNKKLQKKVKGFSKKALKLIYEYDWPGNVREMENTIERCMIISDNDQLDLDDLPQHIKAADTSIIDDHQSVMFTDDNIIPFEKIKEKSIRHALKVTGGNIVEAARKLQLGRATIYRLMEKYGIES
jgi:DNA-binding NtrC family response regulator